MLPLKKKTTRCSLCSLGCFLGLSQSPLGTVTPDYPGEVPELRRGVCNRGNMTAELLGHPLRLDAAKLSQGGKSRSVPIDEALRAVVDAARDSGMTLLIDGNLPCEDIAAGLALAAASKGKLSAGVYLPGEDEAVLDGLAASKAALLTPEGLAECDALLMVGDAFGTHPVVSRPVHALRKGNPRIPLVVIDSLPGRTAIFATHPLAVKAGTESRALAALAVGLGVGNLGKLKLTVKDAVSQSGLPAEALEAAAAALGRAKKLGVILRGEIGKASNWDQIALLAGLVASHKGGGVLACLTYGNALGAHRLARAAGAKLDKLAGTAVVLGTDVVSALSKRECATMLDGVKTLAAAASLPTPTTGAADVVLPLALNVEVGGTTVIGSGEVVAVDAVADPLGDALSAGELATGLARAMGISGVARKVDRTVLGRSPAADAGPLVERGHPDVPKAPEGQLLAVTQSDAIHFHTGGLTGQCAWPKYAAAEPVVSLSAGDAESLGVADGETVKLTSREGEGTAAVEVAKEQAAGVAAVSSGFAQMRGLFSRDAAGRTGPAVVKIEKTGGEA